MSPVLCACGCGEETAAASITNRRRGLIKGQPNRFVNGHNSRRPAEERFWEKVDRQGAAGCWVWTGALRNGYGHFGPSHDVLVYAHRFAYELLVGPIPADLHIDHLCRNRRCVNPAHLEAVTQAENNRRAGLERNEVGQFVERKAA